MWVLHTSFYVLYCFRFLLNVTSFLVSYIVFVFQKPPTEYSWLSTLWPLNSVWSSCWLLYHFAIERPNFSIFAQVYSSHVYEENFPPTSFIFFLHFIKHKKHGIALIEEREQHKKKTPWRKYVFTMSIKGISKWKCLIRCYMGNKSLKLWDKIWSCGVEWIRVLSLNYVGIFSIFKHNFVIAKNQKLFSLYCFSWRFNFALYITFIVYRVWKIHLKSWFQCLSYEKWYFVYTKYFVILSLLIVLNGVRFLSFHWI